MTAQDPTNRRKTTYLRNLYLLPAGLLKLKKEFGDPRSAREKSAWWVALARQMDRQARRNA